MRSGGDFTNDFGGENHGIRIGFLTHVKDRKSSEYGVVYYSVEWGCTRTEVAQSLRPTFNRSSPMVSESGVWMEHLTLLHMLTCSNPCTGASVPSAPTAKLFGE